MFVYLRPQASRLILIVPHPFAQQTASSTAAYDIGFVPSQSASQAAPKFIYLLNADDFDPSSIPKDAFVVYQGHHGDQGARYANVCLPGLAYTEKSATWVNTEGRSQLGRTAVSSPGSSREDWKIIRALSEVLGVGLPYEEIVGLRNRMWDVCPSLVRYDELAKPVNILEAIKALGTSTGQQTATNGAVGRQGPLRKAFSDFYLTDPISRASVTMAQCSKAFTKGEWNAPKQSLASFG